MMLGIDLGSTNSGAAVWDGRLRMIELNHSGSVTMPSVICVADDTAYVGQDAIEKGRQYPDFDFRNFKRRMGEKWHDEEDTGHQTCRGSGDMLHFQGPDGFTYSPVELSSYVLKAIVKAANEYLAPHDTVTGAVICVPATFLPHQVAAVEEAAKLAGLSDVTTLEEPIAAALAYGYDAKRSKCIAVFDLGGGTLDLSCVRTGGGHIKVIAKNGIADLGGADFDKRIADFVVNLWRTEHGTDLTVRDAAMQRILVEAEAAKKRLSDKDKTEFRVEDIDRDKDGVTQHMIYPLDRATFEELTRDLNDRIVGACKALLADARSKDSNFSLKDINDVLLVGGMTRVPSIRKLVSEFFGKAPKKEENPEQVVAMGAAIKAAILEGRKPDVTLADLTSHAIAIETVGNVPAILIPRGSSYPFEEKFTLSNPDADQTELSIRLLYPERTRATECTRIWATEIPVEPGEARSARIPLAIKMDAGGRLFVTAGDQSYEDAA